MEGAGERKGADPGGADAAEALEDLSMESASDAAPAGTDGALSSLVRGSTPDDDPGPRALSRQPSSVAASRGTTKPDKFGWLRRKQKGKVELMEAHLERFRMDLETNQDEMRRLLRKQSEMLDANKEETRQLRELVVMLLEDPGRMGGTGVLDPPDSGRWRNLAPPPGEEGEPEELVVVSEQDARIVVEHFSDDGAFRLLLHTGAARAWRRAGCGFVASATRFLEFVREVIELESARSRGTFLDESSDLGRLRELTAGDILDCIVSTTDPAADPTKNPNPESNRPEEQEGIVKAMDLRHVLLDARFSVRGPVAPALVHFLGLDDPTFVSSQYAGAASELGHARSRGRRSLGKPKRMRRLYHNTTPQSTRALYVQPMPESRNLSEFLREATAVGTQESPADRELVPSIVCVVGELGSGRTELVKQAFGTLDGLNFLRENFPGGCVYARLFGDKTTPSTLVTELALGLCIESEADGAPLLVQLRDILSNQGRTLVIFDDFPSDAEASLACTRLLYNDLLHGKDATEEIFNCVVISDTVVASQGHDLDLTVRKLEVPRLANESASALLHSEAPTLASNSINLNVKAAGNPLRLLSMSRYMTAHSGSNPRAPRKRRGFHFFSRGGLGGAGKEDPLEAWERLSPENKALLIRLCVVGSVTFSTAAASAIRSTSWVVGFALDPELRPSGGQDQAQGPRHREHAILQVEDVGPTLARLQDLERNFFVEEVHAQHWRVTARGQSIMQLVLRRPPPESDEAGHRFFAAHATWLTQSARAYVLQLCHNLQAIERLFQSRGQRKAAVARLREERPHLNNLRVRLHSAAGRDSASGLAACLVADAGIESMLHLENIFSDVLRASPVVTACVAAFAGSVQSAFATPAEREALWRDLRFLHSNAPEADAGAGRHLRCHLAKALNDGSRFKEAAALLRGVVGELRRESTRPPLLARALYELARASDGLSDASDVPLSKEERGALQEKSSGFFKSKKQALAEEAAAEQDAYESFLKRFEVLNAADETDSSFEETLGFLKEALSLWQALGPDYSMDSGRTLRFLGDIHAGKRELEEALRLLRQALHVQRRAMGEEHPDVAATLTSIAVVHEARGDATASADAAFEAFEVAQAVFGKYHAVTVETLADCATAQVRLRSLGAALRIYGVAQERGVALHGSRSLPVARILCNVARVHELRGEIDEAVDLCRRALEVAREVAPEDQQVIATLTQLGELLWQQQSHKEAYDSYKDALRLEKQLRGKLHVSTGQTLRNMALLCHDHLGQEGRAVRFLRAARVAFSSSLGEKHEYTRDVDKLLASWDARSETASMTGSMMSRLSFGP